MKKYLLLLTLCLASCVTGEPLSYKCALIDYPDLIRYNIYEGDYLCFSDEVVSKARSLNYSENEFIQFANYVITNNKLYTNHNQDGIFGNYYADKNGNKIPSTATLHIIGTKHFDEYTKYKTLRNIKKSQNNKVNFTPNSFLCVKMKAPKED
jgi:hypothetical protein